MMTLSKKCVLLVLLIFCVSILAGCSALKTSISKRNLEVETKMSDSLFLDPVRKSKRTIFIEVRNSTDRQHLDLFDPLESAFIAKGYRVIDDPDLAKYWLRVNVLSVKKTDPRKIESILSAGYGGAISGAVIGASVGGVAGRSWRGAGIGGLAGAAIGGVGSVVADAFVEDVLYMVVTDIEIASKGKKGITIQQHNTQNASQGKGGHRTQTSSEVSDRQKYRLRAVSTANQVNLTFEKAIPKLSEGLVRSLSGIF